MISRVSRYSRWNIGQGGCEHSHTWGCAWVEDAQGSSAMEKCIDSIGDDGR